MSANIDRRRFNGPEDAAPLRFRSVREETPAAFDAHKVVIKTGIVAGAAGSVFYESGHTKLICAVHGPRPQATSAGFSDSAQINCLVRRTPFSNLEKRIPPGRMTEASSISTTVAQALQASVLLNLMPKTAIDVYLVFLECDSQDCDVGSCVTAASVAIAHAGIPAKGIAVGLSGLVDPATQALVINPSARMSPRGHAYISLVCLPALDSISGLSVSGALHPRALVSALAELSDASKKVHTVARKALLEIK